MNRDDYWKDKREVGTTFVAEMAIWTLLLAIVLLADFAVSNSASSNTVVASSHGNDVFDIFADSEI